MIDFKPQLMTKLNNKLLAIFLVLGTFFFLTITYILATKELWSASTYHKVSFDGVTTIKNEY